MYLLVAQLQEKKCCAVYKIGRPMSSQPSVNFQADTTEMPVLHRELHGSAIRRFAGGRQVFAEGEQKRWVYQVMTGTLCIYRTLPSGQRQVFDFLFRNMMAGFEDTLEYTHSAETMGVTQLK